MSKWAEANYLSKKYQFCMAKAEGLLANKLWFFSAKFLVFAKGEQDKAIDCKQMRNHAISKNKLNHQLKQEEKPADFKHHTNRRLLTEKTSVSSFAIKYITIHKKAGRKWLQTNPSGFKCSQFLARCWWNSIIDQQDCSNSILGLKNWQEYENFKCKITG